ncbi:MAG: EAL domain-containing protein [Gammaproteobacteria bacterium]|nr:EAL domain-containing protein [Gammaproteobacteria bacterium]
MTDHKNPVINLNSKLTPDSTPQKTLRIIILHHKQSETNLLLGEIQKSGYKLTYKLTDNISELTNLLHKSNWDLIIANYNGPRYSALNALNITKEISLDIPFVVFADQYISKHSDEAIAVEVMKAGAHDFVTYENLIRLVPVVNREIKEAEIRAAHRRADETIRYQAYHDTLTRLPNRALFFDRLQHRIHSAQRNKTNVSLLLFNLSQFKNINEELGYHCGDILLQQLGSRLKSSLRQSDTIARMGGIEFAIIMPDIDHDNTIYTAKKILDLIETPFFINANNYHITTNIGIAFYPEHGLNADNLVKHADIALQSAKECKDGFYLYRNQQSYKPRKDVSLTSELHEAVKNEQLSVYYQPKVNFKTGNLSGVEALVRWDHPEHGFISPDEFIPLAEQTDVIREITIWVFECCLKQYNSWKSQGLALNISINISFKNLLDPSCHERVLRILEKNEVPPGAIELELTESTIMSDPVTTKRMMEFYTCRGIQFSIDDFGTGYSSLSYLKMLPVKVLKIDKSFILEMLNDDNDAVIVRATIDLAHNLGLKVVAEGIEDRATWDLLQILRCDVAQGYYISKAIPADELFEWIESFQHDFMQQHSLN